MSTARESITLQGLDGSNPVAFLAALGVIRCLGWTNQSNSAQLGWSVENRPVIYSPEITRDTLAPKVLTALKQAVNDGVADLGNIIGVEATSFQKYIDSADESSDEHRHKLQFAAAFASDAVIDTKRRTVIPTSLSFSNGQGGKLLLKDFRTLVSRVRVDQIRAGLMEPWRYEDRDEPTFRWDPVDMRTGAHMATDPGSTETRSVMAANVLAFMGLSFLPAMPANGTLNTVAMRELDGRQHFTWPLWKPPLDADVISSLLQKGCWPQSMGIIATFAAPRIMYKKNLYLGTAFST